MTRPHSARLYQSKIWVLNSGYGEVGIIEKGEFKIIAKLSGWTRGLLLKEDIMFAGVSRVLPRFRQYAPGLKNKKHICGIFAMSIKTGKILGSVTWPSGNQIFGIDWIDYQVCEGFLQTSPRMTKRLREAYYSY